MKVIFNIKKLKMYPILSTSSAGVPTYDDGINVPGTVSLTLDNESTTDPFYADGVAYYSPAGATSATGSLENALFPDDVLIKIFKYVEDNNENLLETDEAPSEFGMQFACDSDDGEVRFTYYRVSATKPGVNLQTSETSATINPQSVDITASTITLASGENILKGVCTKDKANYDTYFNSIVVPTMPTI